MATTVAEAGLQTGALITLLVLAGSIVLFISGALAPELNGLDQPPLACIDAVLFRASQSFLSPVGYQTNLLVFGPVRCRFLDIPRYGLPPTVSMTLLVPLLIFRHFNL